MQYHFCAYQGDKNIPSEIGDSSPVVLLLVLIPLFLIVSTDEPLAIDGMENFPLPSYINIKGDIIIQLIDLPWGLLTRKLNSITKITVRQHCTFATDQYI